MSATLSFGRGPASRPRYAATYTGDPFGNKEAADFLKRRPYQPRTADGIPLPHGWVEHRSPSRGIYFEHKATGITQWDFPKGEPSAEQVKAAHHERVGSKVAQLHPGAQVQFKGLQFQPQLNGKIGTCEGWDHATQMIRVRLPSGELKAVKPEKLLVVQAAKARTAPQRLIEGKKEDTGGAGGTWRSKRLVLGSLAGGAAVWWLAWYGAFLADATAREAAAQAEAERRRTEEAAVAAAAAPSPLPPGWRETLDANTGKSYYWREESPAGTTTWERPKA